MWAASSGTGLECCFFLPFLVVWAVVMAGALRFSWITVPAALDLWAQEAGYRILRRQRRSFFRGPFFWRPNSYFLVYRITVQDRMGLTRTGWVGIGERWWSPPDRIEVRWDEERPAPSEASLGATPGNPLMWDAELDGPR
jgi:hypothetical protein